MSYEAPKVIVALDDINEKSVWQLVDQLSPEHCRLKVGKALFTACGPALVKKLVQRNYAVFLDLKFHDIPNTVANACQAAADLGVWMINVHASGGLAMMQAARASIENYDSLLIGVTVLTSFDQHTLAEIGLQFGITNSRTGQILARAIRKLKHPSVACHLINTGFYDTFTKVAIKPEQIKRAENYLAEQKIEKE